MSTSTIKRYLSWGLLPLVACGLFACDAQEPDFGDRAAEQMALIQGSVTYRERMMLPPGVEVEVQLQDISRADAMAAVMETVLITPQSGPPYDFTIEYDPAAIDPRMRYALRATISNGERLLFASTEYIDPFTGNPVEIVVQRVAEPVRRDAPTLEGSYDDGL